MKEPNDGGPAFAGKRFVCMSNGEWKWEPWEGMSLRAWLAGMAMQGLCQGASPDYSKGPCNAAIVERATLLADLQIAELEKNRP